MYIITELMFVEMDHLMSMCKSHKNMYSVFGKRAKHNTSMSMIANGYV